MSKKGIFLSVVFLFLLFSASFSYGQSQQITNGLNYLASTQNPDGSWPGTVKRGALPTTVDVLETLSLLGQGNTTAYTNAISWLQSQALETAEQLSERISALSVAGTDNVLLMSYLDPDTSAWSGDNSPDVDNLDTVLAVFALKKINYVDQNTLNAVINYLLSTQNPDGGWGFRIGDESNIYMTALVSSILQQLPQTTTIATAINKATTFLLAHQNPDGGFGMDAISGVAASTVHETALVYIALVGVITDNTVLGNIINYLTSTQLPDGSWDEDPYSTALALRALYLSQNRPTPPPSPISGTINGTVIDASTSQPLSGASVVSGQLSATTSNTGDFTLSNVPSGSQTITITLPGYGGKTITANITAGSMTNLGAISLSTNTTTGIIKGQ